MGFQTGAHGGQSLGGSPTLDRDDARLYGEALPRGVVVPRPNADRAPSNRWMSPQEVMRHRFMPGQLILGKLGDVPVGRGQLIKLAGYPPMAAVRFSHDDVMCIRREIEHRPCAGATAPEWLTE